MSGFTIRRAREEDVDEIYRMLHELSKHVKEPDAVKITPEALRRNQQLFKCVVAEDLPNDSSVVKPLIGYVSYVYKFTTCDGHMAILDNLYVAPEHRSRGIGSSLLEMVSQQTDVV